MKLKIMTPLLVLTAVTSNAQSLAFESFDLISGNDLQANSSYRFHDVLTGVDAIISINSIAANTTINQIDDAGPLSDASDYAAWRPVIGGISPPNSSGNPTSSTHAVDFTVTFVTANSFNPVTLDQFGIDVYDTDGDDDVADGSDGQDGDVLEFARLQGNLTSAGSQLAVSNPGGGFTEVRAVDSTNNDGVTPNPLWLSQWDYGMTSSTDITLGWRGTDFSQNDDNDRLYGAYFNGTTQVVPEPTSVALISIGSIGLMLRRRR